MVKHFTEKRSVALLKKSLMMAYISPKLVA